MIGCTIVSESGGIIVIMDWNCEGKDKEIAELEIWNTWFFLPTAILLVFSLI